MLPEDVVLVVERDVRRAREDLVDGVEATVAKEVDAPLDSGVDEETDAKSKGDNVSDECIEGSGATTSYQTIAQHRSKQQRESVA